MTDTPHLVGGINWNYSKGTTDAKRLKVDSQHSLQVTPTSVEMRSQLDKRKAALKHTETNRTRKNAIFCL